VATKPTDSAQNRLGLLKSEVTAYCETYWIRREDSRPLTEAERQHHRSAVRRWRLELAAIRSTLPRAS
jgi:hypothetical protein